MCPQLQRLATTWGPLKGKADAPRLVLSSILHTYLQMELGFLTCLGPGSDSSRSLGILPNSEPFLPQDVVVLEPAAWERSAKCTMFHEAPSAQGPAARRCLVGIPAVHQQCASWLSLPSPQHAPIPSSHVMS